MLIYKNIDSKKMNIPSDALSGIIFEGLITAYLENNNAILDEITEIVRNAIIEFDIRKEKKYSRGWVYFNLGWWCNNVDTLKINIHNICDIDLTIPELKKIVKKMKPLYWWLSLKFIKHDFYNLNFKGIYQKFFIEGNGKHIKKRIKFQRG